MDDHSIELKYGHRTLKFQLPQDVEIQTLLCKTEPPAALRDETIQHALSRPMGTPISSDVSANPVAISPMTYWSAPLTSWA